MTAPQAEKEDKRKKKVTVLRFYEGGVL